MINKKTLFLIITLISFSMTFVYSQNEGLTQREIKKLQKLEIIYDATQTGNLVYMQNLKSILTFNRKRKINNTIGTIFRTYSYPSILIGGIYLGVKKDDSQGKDLINVVSGITFGSGVLSYGISVPFKSWSKQNKKELDKLVPLYVQK